MTPKISSVPIRDLRTLMIKVKGSKYTVLGDSSTVEHRTLTPRILVRIQVPQPNLSFGTFRHLTGRSARSAYGSFRQQVKRVAESGDHFAAFPSAVR